MINNKQKMKLNEKVSIMGHKFSKIEKESSELVNLKLKREDLVKI